MNVNEKRLESLNGQIRALEHFGLKDSKKHKQLCNIRNEVLEELESKW